MLSSSGILDALLPSTVSTANSSSAAQKGSQHHHRNNYTSNFLPTDFYRPLSGTLPRRRYSFGGLPDFGEQQISNLLNETSRSISRSMQILYDNRENIDLCEIKKALDIDPRPELAGTNGICAIGGGGHPQDHHQHSNLMAMGANFYSHPNIYSPPGGIYGSGQLKYQSPSAAAALFGPSPLSPIMPLQCQLATGSGPLLTGGGPGVPFDLLSSPTTAMGLGSGCRRYKPNVNYLFSKPTFGGNGSYAYPPYNGIGSNGPGMNYYNASHSNYPWNGSGVGNPLSLNQRLMAGLDCTYPAASSAHANMAMRNYHYGSHPTISKYSNTTPRSAFHSSSHNNYFASGNLTSSAINATTACYPPAASSSSAFLLDGGGYNNPNPFSAPPGYHNNSSNSYSSNNYSSFPHPSAYRHGAYVGGGGSSFQHPPRSLPLSYYPAYKMSAGMGGSGSGFYNAGRHGGGGFNANSLSRVGNLVGGGSGDMKRQVSFKFDVDQLSIGS